MTRIVPPGIFAIWLLLSIIVYIPAARTVLRAIDWFMLIPTWQFFAPVPGQQDFNVLYQDKYADGTLTQWTEVAPAARRRWWAALWNPGKRANKALFDIVQELSAVVEAGKHVPEFTVPYLSLLNYISSISRSTSPTSTHFLVMSSQGNSDQSEPQVLFISRFHAL